MTARRLGLGYTPFSPLAGGVLTGKHKRGGAAKETGIRACSFAAAMRDDR